MPDLKRYRQKRTEETPEPLGDEPRRRPLAGGAERAFVVQQHDATRMHWDLRLEIDGVLASWAVPKGPSLDPAEKRFAARTEDHPLEYAHFEGIIPRGNYGAGAMIVWDRGGYHTVGGDPPASGLEAGKLDLVFNGHKLRGRFALVRMKGEDGKAWLLLRKGSPPESTLELVDAQPESVLSGLTVGELREGATRTDVLRAGALEADAPARKLDASKLRPMLASTADGPFSRDGWLFEVKYDGARVLGAKRGDDAQLVARSGRDATTTYPEVTRALARLPVSDCVLDGEVVALDARGVSSFERLQRRFTNRDPLAVERLEIELPCVYYVFDLLAVCGQDLRRCPLHVRKRLLSQLVPRNGQIRFADHVEGDGEALFEAARAHELEGVVAKRADSPYDVGKRTRCWLKIKVPRSVELAIVGWASGKGSRGALGSLMVAGRRHDALSYAGNVGSGLDEPTLEFLLERLPQSRIEAPAFEGGPDPVPDGAVFVKPELVCTVRYTEVTSAGHLRHPVFAGLVDGADPAACVLPEPVGSDSSVDVPDVAPELPTPEPRLDLSNLDKVFWPVEGYTKGDLLAYYEAVWPWLEPYLHDRPVVLTRYPDGIDGKFFYQKNAPEFTPDWVERVEIDGTDYFVCNELRSLLYVINSGAIPLHVWSARLDTLERPDWLILDLDPKEAPFAHVVTLAKHIHALLEALGAPHFVKTSGQDGLHVMLPLGAQLGHAQAKSLGEVLARVVCAELPEIATIARPLAARGERVYVDYLQNGRGKLIASPFSVRPRSGAPVSMPLTWKQVTARLDPVRWNLKTSLRRLRERGDPMRDLLDQPVDVAALLEALAERL